MSDLLPRRADVTVIGGGVIGSSAAYHLAVKKIDVVLLEKGDFASGTSSACDGLIFLQSKKPGPHLELAMAGRSRFDDLPEELESDIELRCKGGMIIIERDSELQAMERFVEEQRKIGLEVSLLEGYEARELEPCLSDDVTAATFCPLDGQVNPISLTLAFLKAAKSRGAKVFSHTPATGIELRGGAIEGVRTLRGVIRTETVVNAGGVYAPQIGKMVGLDIPIVPRRGQLLVTEALPRLLSRCLISARYIAAKYDSGTVSGEDRGISLEQTENGNFLLGSTREFVGFDRRTTQYAIQRILSDTTRVIPRLKDAHLIRAFAGLRPYTPDGLPILGKVRSVGGFIMAAGHEGDGIALSSVTGQLVAEIVADGKSGTPLEPFALERFFPPKQSEGRKAYERGKKA